LRLVRSCEEVSAELPLLVDGSQRPSPSVARHLGSCLRCQAELASYRRLLRALRSLRDDPVAPPPQELLGETLRALAAHVASRRHRDPWVVAGAVVAVAMAIALAALGGRSAWRSRAGAELAAP
jgi:anti-sigma factor RsiW